MFVLIANECLLIYHIRVFKNGFYQLLNNFMLLPIYITLLYRKRCLHENLRRRYVNPRKRCLKELI